MGDHLKCLNMKLFETVKPGPLGSLYNNIWCYLS